MAQIRTEIHKILQSSLRSLQSIYFTVYSKVYAYIIQMFLKVPKNMQLKISIISFAFLDFSFNLQTRIRTITFLKASTPKQEPNTISQKFNGTSH